MSSIMLLGVPNETSFGTLMTGRFTISHLFQEFFERRNQLVHEDLARALHNRPECPWGGCGMAFENSKGPNNKAWQNCPEKKFLISGQPTFGYS